MSMSPLFDRTKIVKGVPEDADIELQCRKCKTLFHTLNANYVGYSPVNYANPKVRGNCKHAPQELKPTKNYCRK